MALKEPLYISEVSEVSEVAPGGRAEALSGGNHAVSGLALHEPGRRGADLALAEELAGAGLERGLFAIGIGPAAPFIETRRHLYSRKEAGLSASMAFTYKNPERSTDPSRIIPGAASLLVGVLPYPGRAHAPRSGRSGLPPAPGAQEIFGGDVAAYARRDYYAALRSILDFLCGRLLVVGWKAKVVVDDNALVDREAAFRVGLGSYGKNCLFLVPGLGSLSVIGSVVTDAPLAYLAWRRGPGKGQISLQTGAVPQTGSSLQRGRPADEPARKELAGQRSRCGSCHRCLDSCPTGALTAPGVLDARRCLAWLLQQSGVFPRAHRIALGNRIYGCDTCQDACPLNRSPVDPPSGHGARVSSPASGRAAPGALGTDEGSRGTGKGSRGAGQESARAGQQSARAGQESARAGQQSAGTDDGSVDILALLASEPGELLGRYGRWYIPERDARYILRNALVVLGNVGDGCDPRVGEALRAKLADPDPLLRLHAVWAAARLARQDLLVAALAREGDLDVLAEIVNAAWVPELSPRPPRACVPTCS